MISEVVVFSFLTSILMVTSSLGFAQAEYYLDIDDEEPAFEYNTKPTFGLDHESNDLIVDNGFKINGEAFDITNNFHTPFEEQEIEIGKLNSFEATVYATKGLKVQEFIFGISEVGKAHLAESTIEVWYNLDGSIKNFKITQNSDVIDKDHVFPIHHKTNCQESDEEINCDHTKLLVRFLEPLKDKIMAIKAIDFENRYQITYLNEGIHLSGESITPNTTILIPSPERDEGLISVTQIEKYSSYWMAEDGRTFEKNKFGSFKEIRIDFERFQDKGTPKTRLHSEFGKVIADEQERALSVFDSSNLVSELHDSFSIDMVIGERITDEIKEKMLKEEKIAKLKLENSIIQARF